ncbi:hypothetical protein O7632_27775 [Solwaraspora sp. WMMD406]|uniref:hypothetical protein n=1 Tax=Solwaraspora sp. WMMD406 TaxID=3016095 RepID=UPI002417E34A|nr:hypothetical protein [Solwaraspora sp. WMMD406]MDG4767864.1 hypothetical protein [Solwaraspora sp. WMMD406]
MGLLDEDRHPPSWLADYGAIEADVDGLAEFADSLAAEVTGHYARHVEQVFTDLLPEGSAGVTGVADAAADPDTFPELAGFLGTHGIAARDTAYLMHFYQTATGAVATAAATVSARYRDVDALAAARLADVEAALDRVSPDA